MVLAEKKVKEEDNSSRRAHQSKTADHKIINSDMVPGYTGYIPKSEKYFGDRFAVICDLATNDIIGQNERYRNSKLNQAKQVLPR